MLLSVSDLWNIWVKNELCRQHENKWQEGRTSPFISVSELLELHLWFFICKWPLSFLRNGSLQFTHFLGRKNLSCITAWELLSSWRPGCQDLWADVKCSAQGGWAYCSVLSQEDTSQHYFCMCVHMPSLQTLSRATKKQLNKVLQLRPNRSVAE